MHVVPFGGTGGFHPAAVRRGRGRRRVPDPALLRRQSRGGRYDLRSSHHWTLAFWPGRWDLCYYYPGLRNSILYGRHRFLGPIFAGPYALIHSFAVRRANLVLAAASRDAIMRHQRHLRRLGARIEIHSLPTATDVELFRPQRRETLRPDLGLPLDVPVYIYAGRLTAVKGVPLILRAFQIVQRARPKALLLIAGDGEERSRLTRLAQRLGLAQSVRFLGMLLPEQLASCIAAADAGLFASYDEGFSVAMVEQLACGRPIVSTEVSGARELITEGKNGFILPDRNVESYARRMLDVLDLPSAEQFSRSLAVQHYSMESLWDRLRRAWPAFTATTGAPQTDKN
jgi:glycosyltransferase involved in cell wall biosynthesis